MYISVSTSSATRNRPKSGFEPQSQLSESLVANNRSGTADCLGSRDEQVQNPIVGSWFRIEQGPPTAPPKYEYDEVGIVIEGT